MAFANFTRPVKGHEHGIVEASTWLFHPDGPDAETPTFQALHGGSSDKLSGAVEDP